MFRLLRQISYRQLRQSWGRTALVIGGAATGVTLIVAINVINTSILTNFRRMIDLIAGPAQLEVTLGVGEVGFQESALSPVRAYRGVRAAVPLVRGTVALADDPAETLQLFGADLVMEEELNLYPISSGNRAEILRDLADVHSILVTAPFARRHGIDVGETLALSTPNGVQTVTVRGLLEATGLAALFGGQLAVMDLPASQLLLGKPERIDQIDVVLRDGVDVDTAQHDLQAVLPGLSVMRPEQRGIEYEHILGSFQAMLTALSLLCLVAGIFIVYNTTSTGVAHRAKVLAWLRLVGAEPSRVFWLLLLEAMILGTVGTLIGVPQGIALGWLLSGAVSDSMGVIFQLRFPVASITIDPRQHAAIAMLGILATLFASFFAARRAAGMEPLEVLRIGPRSLETPMSSRRILTYWLVLVAISIGTLIVEVQTRSIAWGNFGSTLWFASSIVIAVPLVRWSAGLLSRLLPRVFGAEGKVAVASLFRSPTRTGVTVAAIALVLTVALTFATLSYSHRSSLDTYFKGGFLASDLVVSAQSTEGGWLETPISDDIVAEVAAVPGIARVDSFRVLPGQIYRGVRIAIAGGSEGLADPSRYPPGWYREGDPETAGRALSAGTGLNISTSLSDRFDLHVGDSMDLQTPSGPLTLAIVGVVPDYMSDRGSVILNRRLLVEHWQDHSVNRVNAFLTPGHAFEDVRAQIISRVGPRYRLRVLSLRELMTYHSMMVNRAFALTDAIQLLIIIVTVAGIFDLLLSAIVERHRELALWRVIGADDRAVRRSIVIESTTIGLLGAVLGIGVGFVTSWIWVGINFRYLLGYYLDFHFATLAALWYVTLVVATTVLTGYGAALQATRQPVLGGIQHE